MDLILKFSKLIGFSSIDGQMACCNATKFVMHFYSKIISYASILIIWKSFFVFLLSMMKWFDIKLPNLECIFIIESFPIHLH